MNKSIYLRILILTVLIPTCYSKLEFNNLEEKLIMQLLKVKPKTNLVASSLLLRFPLCKLAGVAAGDAKQELMTVLGYKADSDLKTCYSRLRESLKFMTHTDLTVFNRLYVNYTNDINASFFINTTENFGIQVEKVGFNYPKSAINFINRMVGITTYKRIAEILDPGDINLDTMMVIVTGAHFKGTWEFPFDFRMTKLQKFRHFDGKISRIPMMTKVDSFWYVAAGDCQALSIHLGTWKSSITFVLPNKPEDLPKLLEKFHDTPNYVNTLVKSMHMAPTKVTIPRFKIKTYLDWTGFLQEMGVYAIFNKNASGLSAMLKKNSDLKNIYLSKVKQKVFIQIDEMGVARFTRAPNRNMGPPDMPIFLEVPKFNADRPFYFEITLESENTRYHLFTGVFYGPEPSAPNI